jgi:hypothetical protein
LRPGGGRGADEGAYRWCVGGLRGRNCSCAGRVVSGEEKKLKKKKKNEHGSGDIK